MHRSGALHCSWGSVHSSRGSVHSSGALYTAPGTLCIALGPLCIALGTLHIALGALYTALGLFVHGSRGSVHRSRALDTALGLSALLWSSVHSSRCSVHSSRASAHSCKCSVHSSKCSVHSSSASAHYCHLAAWPQSRCCSRCPSCPSPTAASLPGHSLCQHLRAGRSLPVSLDTPASARASRPSTDGLQLLGAPGQPLGDPRLWDTWGRHCPPSPAAFLPWKWGPCTATGNLLYIDPLGVVFSIFIGNRGFGLVCWVFIFKDSTFGMWFLIFTTAFE